jgi:hypothetical protein
MSCRVMIPSSFEASFRLTTGSWETPYGGQWLEKITIIAKAKKEKASKAGGDQTDKLSGIMEGPVND